jgi:Ca-activated chloride channel family protein
VSFAWPVGLLGLALVPLALGLYVLTRRRRGRYAVQFTNLEVLAAVAERRSTWRRRVPAALFLGALGICLVALARPQMSVATLREQATVVLTMDTSGSMLASDVKPSRMAAAKQALRIFVDRLPARYRVAVVSFAGNAQVVATPSSDHARVLEALKYPIGEGGTAIGDALQLSVNVAKSAMEGLPLPAAPDQSPVAILLLSDGSQTTGLLRPLQGAKLAKRARIPVYTVALGTAEGQIEFKYNGVPSTIPVPPDPQTLRAIARVTRGEFFNAGSAARLTEVYENLGSHVGRTTAKREVTSVFGAMAAVLLGASGLLSAVWTGRFP